MPVSSALLHTWLRGAGVSGIVRIARMHLDFKFISVRCREAFIAICSPHPPMGQEKKRGQEKASCVMVKRLSFRPQYCAPSARLRRKRKCPLHPPPPPPPTHRFSQFAIVTLPRAGYNSFIAAVCGPPNYGCARRPHTTASELLQLSTRRDYFCCGGSATMVRLRASDMKIDAVSGC